MPDAPATTIAAPPAHARGGAERRTHPRLSAQELHGLVTARVKYGDRVKLIDLSVGGVLVEAPGKLVRDASIVFEFAGPGHTVVVPSRAVRVATLAHLDDTGRYEGAFSFKRPLPLADLLREPAKVWHYVAAQCRNGRIVQGYTSDFQPWKQTFSVAPTPFETGRSVPVAEINTIFFLRD